MSNLRTAFCVCVLLCVLSMPGPVFAQAPAVNPVFTARIQAVTRSLQQKNVSRARSAADQFWIEHSHDPGFVDAARQIKDQYWIAGEYAAHFDLCERIVDQFPNDPLAIGIQVDQVTGYIKFNQLAKAEEALSRYWQRFSQDKRFVDLARRVKDQYWLSGLHAEHNVLCERLIEQFPDDPFVMSMYADLVTGYIRDHDMPTARTKLDDFWKQYGQQDGFIRHACYVKDVCWMEQQYDEHFRICERIINAFRDAPEIPAIRRDVITGYIRLDQTDRAAPLLEQYWKDYQSHPNFVRNMIAVKDACWSVEDYTGHFKLCERLIAECADDPLILQVRRDVITGHIKLEEMDEASRQIESLWDHFHEDKGFVETIRCIKDHCWTAGEYDLHFALCDRVAAECPADPLTAGIQVDAITGYIKRGQITRADQYLVRFMQQRKTHDRLDEYLVVIANEYSRQGLPDQASMLCRYVCEKPSARRKDLVLAHGGRILAQIAADTASEEVDEQIAQLIKTYGNDPAIGEALFRIGDAYHYRAEQNLKDERRQRSDFKNAVRVWEEAVTKSSDPQEQCRLLYYTGTTYHRIGDCRRALTLLEKVIAGWPGFEQRGHALALSAECCDILKHQKQMPPGQANQKMHQAYTMLAREYPDRPQAQTAKDWLKANPAAP